ncbi:MAG TPA: sugar ABC transporter ATP-binding protein, partial [Solirubrobacteraceae bacterium]|nr:sugar ABC transporter ATP-binding protein [Solirubrobacteraceae bacterium]
EVLHGVDLDATGGSILAVLGENGAGKSTLMKIFTGVYEPDAGEIEIGGEAYPKMNPRRARALGIRMINQEILDAPTLSVAENISLGRLPARHGIVSRREMRRRAREVLADMEIDMDLDRHVGTLRPGERQVVEIARALSDEARVLILDEPTSALSHDEVVRLFVYLRRLRDNGVAIVYITHRLDEVHELSDRVEVLRDGDVATTGPTTDFDRTALVSAMIGRSASAVSRPDPPSWPIGDEPRLEFRSASVRNAFEDISLAVRPGEIVAVYGKLGSGAAELLESAFGLRRLTGGEIVVDGKARQPKDAADAIHMGIGFVPPERKQEAIFAVRPVSENISVPSWKRLAQAGMIIRRATEAKAYRRQHEALQIRSRNDPMQPIGTLSGGNQQKVVLGRWLERGTPTLLMAEPTRGVDVGARAEIYRSMRQLAAQGIAILISSSDYEEVVQVADRAIVLARGRLATELEGDDVTTSRLLAASGG